MIREVRLALVATTIAAVWLGDSTPTSARNVNGTWYKLPVGGCQPSARKHHVMVFDPVSNSVYMHGGENSSAVLGDTWKLDLTNRTWQQLPSGGPGPRHGHSAAYADNPPRMLLFGGRTNTVSPPPIESFKSDTWALSLGASPQWSELVPGPGTEIVQGCSIAQASAFRPRTHSATVYFQSRLVMFGGREGPGVGTGMQDTWSKSLTGGWEHMFGSTHYAGGHCGDVNRRFWHSLIVDPNTGTANPSRMILFGGLYDGEAVHTGNLFVSTPIDYLGDVSWIGPYDAPSGASGDFRRYFHTAVYDPNSPLVNNDDRMVVLGGYFPEGPIVGESTNLFVVDLDSLGAPDGNESLDWSTLSPSGPLVGEIAEHAAVYDSNADRMIVFGGVSASGFRGNDVWVLDFSDDVGDVTAPAAASLTGAKGKTTAAIAWLAPGDDGSTGTATSYDLRRSTSLITESNFCNAQPVTTGAPQSAGSEECVRLTKLVACQTYYYALRTHDDVGNVSPLSTLGPLTQNCSGGEVDCAGSSASDWKAPAAPSSVEYRLTSQNPATDLSSLFYGIPSDRAGESLEISIFDVAGRRVRLLEQGTARAGEFSTDWDLRGSDGRAVSVGVYFARLQLGNLTRTQKIVVGPVR